MAKARAIDDALAHAAGELVRIVVGEPREAGAVEIVADDVLDDRLRAPCACAGRRRRCPTPSSRERSSRPGTPSNLPGAREPAGTSISIVPEVGVSSPARMRSSVVLPQPGRADDHEELARRDVERDVVDRDELAERLLQIANPDRRPRRLRTTVCRVGRTMVGAVARTTVRRVGRLADGTQIAGAGAHWPFITLTEAHCAGQLGRSQLAARPNH